MTNNDSFFGWRNLLRLFVVAAGYFILARLSLFLSFQTSNATPVWPPSGYAFAILLIFGFRISPAILIGAFAANVLVFYLNNAASFTTSLWVSLFISIGNLGEALTGYYLLNKLNSGVANNLYFRDTTGVSRFLVTALLMSMVSSTIGTSSVYLGNIILAEHFGITWLTWWLGDVSGIFIITPLILLWRKFVLSVKATGKINARSLNIKIETVVLFICIILLSGIIFDNWFFDFFIFQWAYWIIPLVVWAAIRFEQHETISAVFFCAVISVWGSLNGGGPFVSRPGSPLTLNDSLLILQAFVCIIATTTLILNASVNDQKQTEAKLRDIGNELEHRVSLRTQQLKESSEKIETVNRRLTEAQRLAHIGHWEWDIASNRISWSDELFRIFGLTPQTFEASYEHYLKYIHPDDKEPLHETVQQSHKTHQPYSIYHRIVRPDGVVRILHGRGEVILNDKQEPLSMVGTAQDVTDIKQAEESIKQLADDLMQYNIQLEQINKELESFTFVTSHDLQEPLRKIRTFLQLIEEKESEVLSAASKDYMQRIIAAAERMQQLINDLLLYSKTIGSEEHFQKTDLDQLFDEVKEELADVLEEKKAIIEKDDLPQLRVIPFQVQQLFTNLMSNALKFSRDGVPPQIKITVKNGK